MSNDVLNIVIPMAGRGSRFQCEGFTVPKPLIPVGNRPMIKLVIENLRPSRSHRFVFIVLAELLNRHNLAEMLCDWAPGCSIVEVDRVTAGAACTVLLARAHIDSQEPLMIANCDQWIDASVDDYLEVLDKGPEDGLIMTMWADHPKWSYVRLDANGEVCEVVEKQVVSNHATVGIYNFRRGRDFVQAADRMIEQNIRVNGEFYVAPVYNQLLAVGQRIALYNIGREYKGMYGLGTPEDLRIFEREWLPLQEP